MVLSDPYRLERFVTAQEAHGTFQRAVGELRRGRKQSHWMWFVFPQIAGLGRSATSKRFALSSLDEARAYLDHPLLGPRLMECTGMVAASAAASAEHIVGGVDAQKLRSSMTVFLRADDGAQLFQQVLDRYFGGSPDSATGRLL
jgi:uncharacterized protein (DUF1810 family)